MSEHPRIASLQARFLSGGDISSARSGIRDLHARGKLGHALRHHRDEEVSNRTEICFRDGVDRWLLGLSISEVARISGWVPSVLPGEAENAADLDLPEVRAFYETHYPMPLVTLLRYRLRTHLPIRLLDEQPRSFALFARISEECESNRDVQRFFRFLDDFKVKDIVWTDVQAEVTRDPGVVVNALLSAEDTPMATGIRGAVRYLRFLGALDDLLGELSDHPLLAGAMWLHHSYWLRRLQFKADRKLQDFVTSLASAEGPPAGAIGVLTRLSQRTWRAPIDALVGECGGPTLPGLVEESVGA